MLRFIHNRTDITTWMGYNFKIKSTKSKATFLDKNIFFGFQAADH